MKKKRSTHLFSYPNDFTNTLAFGDRRYLVELAMQRLGSYDKTHYDGLLTEIAAIHYLYGGEPSLLHGGNTGRTFARFDNGMGATEHELEPQLFMRYFQKPLLTYKGEMKAVYEEARRQNEPSFLRLYWSEVVGDIPSTSDVRATLRSRGTTAAYNKWLVKHKQFAQHAKRWYQAFHKKHPNTKLRLWTKHEGYVTLYIPQTPKTRTPSKLSVAEKRRIHARYRKDIEAYWRFLVTGFCDRTTLFPKSLFE
ncbi:MAG: hypothetical protein ACE5F4_02325 [Candidatus Paceibacteria bacterium]